MLERREFLQTLGAAAMAAGWLRPAELEAQPARESGWSERLLCLEAPPLPSEELFARAGEAAAGEANVGSNWRTPADYARHLIKVLLPEVAWRAWERARHEGRNIS